MVKKAGYCITYGDALFTTSAAERTYLVQADSEYKAKEMFYKDHPNSFIFRMNTFPIYYPEKEKKEEKTMDENRYNTRVRHAISDELVESRKKKHNLECRCGWIRNYLKESENTIMHNEYSNLIEELTRKEDMIKTLETAIDIWDQAREICMNIADEMVGEHQ